jgi:hypothetical protein
MKIKEKDCKAVKGDQAHLIKKCRSLSSVRSLEV